MLDILLLSADSAAWAKRVRWIIFDEVHSIGGADGAVWERLVLLAPCPFLALSATLGNAAHFHGWLQRVEARRGRRVLLIERAQVALPPAGLAC